MSANVQLGYKQTEIGMIPQDWDVIPLSKCARHISRGASPRPIDSPHWFDENSNVGWVRISDVTSSKRYLEETTQRLSEAGIRKSRFIKSGSLIMSICATVGRPIETRIDACIHDGFVVFSQPTIDQSFLYHVLAGLEPTWAGRGQTGSQMNLNTGIIKSRLIPYPTAAKEQGAIATALSDMDTLISGLDQLIAKKRDIKQATMQQLLTGQTRLPGFCGEWEEKTLFDLAERKKELFDDGDWIESEHITTEGVRLIQTGNVGIGRFVEKETKKFISDISFRSLRCKQLDKGDLLLCRLADPAGRACILPEIGEDRIITSVDVTIFRPSTKIADRNFLMNIFSTPAWFRVVSDRSGGTTHKRISRGALGRISIRLPSITEQTAISKIFSDMDAELAALETRRDKAFQLKQGMMQELLTGRIRLI